MKQFFKGAAVGGAAAAAVLTATAAIAGTGVGGIFNLGQNNTVNQASALTGTTNGDQLDVVNNGTASNATAGTFVGKSATAAAIRSFNTGGGPALGLSVNAGKAPFTTNSAVKVANLNADQLDGYDSAVFVKQMGDLNGRPCISHDTHSNANHLGTTYAAFGSSYQPVEGRGSGSLVTACLYADPDEPNNTRDTAKLKTCPSSSCPIYASIYPSGDDDWYKWMGVKLATMQMQGYNGTLNPLPTFDVYKDGFVVASNQTTYDPPDDTATHNYEVRVHGQLNAYLFYFSVAP
jgi:hypothetical protein